MRLTINMDEAGHTFVVHGDLTKLACDLVLVPTDAFTYVTPHFTCFGGPHVPDGWRDGAIRATEAVPETGQAEGRLVCWVNTGATPDTADLDWLMQGVRQGLDRAAENLRGRPCRNGRARHLIALPMMGTGEGGFGAVLGDVVGRLLSECEQASIRHRYDIAIVCWRRSDYAALQAQRLDRPVAPALTPGLSAEVRRLGDLAATGRLTLFLGAGVSQPAGLPGWADLIDQLAKESRAFSGRADELKKIDVTDAAWLIEDEFGTEKMMEVIKEQLSRPFHALGHALLASLRTRHAITTNFDLLYEQACEVPFGGRPLTLPWQRAEPGQPWLLKLHGDVDGGLVVITGEDFQEYDERWRPLASLFQAAMMTSHVLFVGYSLKDGNFTRLARDVSKLLDHTGRDRELANRDGVGVKAGTVLSLNENAMRRKLWRDLHFVAVTKADKPSREAERVLDVVLDRIGVHAASGEPSYRMDPRYEALAGHLDRPVTEKLSELAELVGNDPHGRWREVTELLKTYGYRKKP